MKVHPFVEASFVKDNESWRICFRYFPSDVLIRLDTNIMKLGYNELGYNEHSVITNTRL